MEKERGDAVSSRDKVQGKESGVKESRGKGGNILHCQMQD